MSPDSARPARAQLVVEIIRDDESLDALADEWDALDRLQFLRLPFTSPLWNRLWWQHFRAARRFVRDQLHCISLRDDTGRLVAVAPLMLTHRPAFGPFRVRILQFFGADTNVTELRGMVCRPEYEARAVAALQQHLTVTDKVWDWFPWLGLRNPDSLAGTRVPLHLGAPVPAYYLKLPESWEEFRASRSRNIKESLRKCYNSLKRDGHEFRFRVIEHADQTEAAIRRFLELHAARARADGTIRHLDVFGTQQNQDFLIAYAQAMAGRGQLRVFQIEIAGTVVATRIGFALGRSLYLYYSGYDLAWSRYSIMTTVVAESIKWAIGNGFTIVNLSTGNDISKTRWGPKERLYASAVWIAQGWRSRLAYRLYGGIILLEKGDSLLSRLLSRLRRGR